MGAYYTKCRDANSPVSGSRLPYLDVHYGLPHGRTYLLFLPTAHPAATASRTLVKPLSLAARHPSAPLFTYLHCSRV